MEALQGGRFAWASGVADRLWPAWRGLQTWEDAVDDEMGERLGDVVLLLWAVHRFAGMEGADVILDTIVDNQTAVEDGDPILHDIVLVAFAMGASWADSRNPGIAGGPPPPPRFRIVDGRQED